MKLRLLLFNLLFCFSLCIDAQIAETRYAIETTFDGKTPVTYEQIYGSLRLNSTNGELTFTTNLAKLKTGNSTIDSTLSEVERLPFSFQGMLGQDLFGIIKDVNDDSYHKVVGSVTVNNVSYSTIAMLKIENISNKSDMSKMLLDMRLDIDPKVIIIPYLSDYFNNILIFQIEDGTVNKLK